MGDAAWLSSDGDFDREGALFTLIDTTGRILLQHRTDDAPILPGHWAFFGGGLEPGESAEQALAREAAEELEIVLPTMDCLGRFGVRFLGQSVRFHLFVGPLTHTPAGLAARQREGQGLGLFSAAEVSGLAMAAHDRAFAIRIFDRVTVGIGGRATVSAD